MELDIIHGQAVEASENVKEGNEQVRGVSLSIDITLYAPYSVQVCTILLTREIISEETGIKYCSLLLQVTISTYVVGLVLNAIVLYNVYYCTSGCMLYFIPCIEYYLLGLFNAIYLHVIESALFKCFGNINFANHFCLFCL